MTQVDSKKKWADLNAETSNDNALNTEENNMPLSNGPSQISSVLPKITA